MIPIPQDFLREISQFPELECLSHSLDTPPDVSIRLNPLKFKDAGQVGFDIGDDCVPWCEYGRYLTERPQFTFDPALHQGLYYVQDASSMAVNAVMKELLPQVGADPAVLDACAAPGGKTTAILSALDGRGLVVANEYDYKRAEILVENLQKWGATNAMASRGDTKKFKSLADFFDIIAVDAPCSGEGMMRKDEKAREQWSHGLVQACAATQREILGNVWRALKPGGFLIYSTCTFNLDEDERNALQFIEETGAESVKIEALEQAPGITMSLAEGLHAYRFLPGKVRGEGLFLTVIRKPGTLREAQILQKKSKGASSQYNDLLKWTNLDMEIIAKGDELYGIDKKQAARAVMLMKNLDVIMPGVHFATAKGKDLIPNQALALSAALNADAFPTCEVGLEDAIAFLRREAVALTDAPKGFVLLKYKSNPLGFVKNLGNRSNNLYPKNWRILSSQR